MSDTSAASLPTPSLDRFFKPRSVALVGATERSIWSVSAFDNLARFGFAGKVHLINPKGGVVHGQSVATSCVAVGEAIDAALLMVPENALGEALEDLRQAGIAGAVVLSSGFAEVGAAGAARQHQLAQQARQAGIRLIGPNCLGFANFLARAPIWTTPLRRPMPNPSLAIVSQSGALAGQLEQFAYQQRIALTHMVSTGNEADVTVADVIEYLAGLPEPRAIAVFLETVRDPARFIAAAQAARRAHKALVVLKVGSSEASARAAQAHTGSLVGNDRVFNALCTQLGIARVKTLEELIVTADLMARLKPYRAGGLALIAMSGGLCEIATDQGDELGIAIPTLAPATLTALRATLPPLATPGNPLDITGAAMLQPELITRSITTVASDPAVGLMAYVFDVPLQEDKRGAARNFIKHVAAGLSAVAQPALMISHAYSGVSAEGRALADEYALTYSGAGVSLGLRALSQVFKLGRFRARTMASAPLSGPPPGNRPQAERAVLDHLARFGVGIIPAQLVHSASAAAQAARQFAGPVVLKVASPDIAHKTEVGGVALNVAGESAVEAAYQSLCARVSAAQPSARIDGVLVSPMRAGGVELLVGVTRDPQWGLAIAVGLGGVWVEALRDTALRLLPVDETDVLEMLQELRGGRLLDRFRGAPAVDRAALARAVVAIGNAALALGPQLAALEINPLLSSVHGIEALDGLAIWE